MREERGWIFPSFLTQFVFMNTLVESPIDLQNIDVRSVASGEKEARWNALMREHHYLLPLLRMTSIGHKG